MITSKADLRRWGQLVNVIEFTTSIKMCVKGNLRMHARPRQARHYVDSTDVSQPSTQ